ncbi:MAG: tagatose 1,6-diphosphate aldolase [Dehalococcoidia bacterium]|nr:tagatose 1,6-diphosphate aldolase [Dehalococcoidia bacterium]
MQKISIGKIRGLQQISGKEGIFTICAMDHRGSLQHMIDEKHPEKVKYNTMVQRKLELCSALAPHASAILLDPIFGAAQCIQHSALPGDTGLLVSIEATGYSGDKEQRITKLLDGWDVEKIKRMGASAVKILIYYRPDLKAIAKQQQDTVKQVAQDCIRYDIPFLVEPICYPISFESKNKREFSIRKAALVLKTANEISSLPIDVLKSEFPADMKYDKDEGKLLNLCQQLNEMSEVPWVLLSAGADYEQFYQEVKIACKAGASGFLGGRAIWQEAMAIDDGRERMSFLSTTAADRLKELSELAIKYGTPWHKKSKIRLQDMKLTSEKWHREF